MALEGALSALGAGTTRVPLPSAALTPEEEAADTANEQNPAVRAELEKEVARPNLHPVARRVLQDYLASSAAPHAIPEAAQGDMALSGALDALTPEPEKPAAPQQQKGKGATGAWGKKPGELSALVTGEKQPGGLPDTALGRTAAGVLGEAKGAFDIAVEGPAQLLAHAAADIYPSNWPGSEFFQKQVGIAEEGRKARQAGFEAATAQVPTSAKAGEFAGNIMGAVALPQGKAAEGANLFNRAIAAAKTGGVIGLATPTEDKDFWTTKALQTGLSAAAGFIGQPIAEGAAKIIGATAEGALNVGRRVLSFVSGQSTDAAVGAALQKASPELKQAIQAATSQKKNIDPAALGRQVEADSLPVRMSLTPGQATQNPVSISNEMNFRSQNPAVALKFQDQEKQLVANIHAIREIAAPEATATNVIASGEHIAKAGEDMLTAQRDMTTKLYKKLTDANGGELPIDGKAFADSATAVLKKQMKSPFLPSQVRTILDGFKNGEEAMTFENFENLRTILAAAGRTADRAGDGNASAAVHLVRETLENTPISSEVSGVKKLADAARASARFGFDLQRENPMLKAIASGNVKDNTLVQRYIVGGSKQEITNLANSFQHDPVALQNMKAGVMNYLETASGATQGKFSQANYNKVIQTLGPKLDIIFGPEEAAHIRTLGAVARYTQLAPRGAWVNSSNTDVANLARTGGGLAARAIDRITGTPIGSIANSAATAALERKANTKAVNSIVNVGAGISRPSNSSQFLLHDFPMAAGQAAVIPLAALAGHGVAQKSGQ